MVYAAIFFLLALVGGIGVIARTIGEHRHAILTALAGPDPAPQSIRAVAIQHREPLLARVSLRAAA